MADPVPLVTDGAAPFYTSKVFAGIIVAFLMSLGAAIPGLGKIISKDPVTLTLIVTTALSSIAALASLWAAVKRWFAPMQPLTTTQAKADVHPATIVAAEQKEVVAQVMGASPKR